MVDAKALVDGVPDGVLRLVDNRILVGDATWIRGPKTLAVLHPKHTKPDNRAFIVAILDIVNTLHGYDAKAPIAEFTATLRAEPPSDDDEGTGARVFEGLSLTSTHK